MQNNKNTISYLSAVAALSFGPALVLADQTDRYAKMYCDLAAKSAVTNNQSKEKPTTVWDKAWDAAEPLLPQFIGDPCR